MEEERETVYLVDGSSYIYRAYHAIRELSTSKGLPTNAIFGFTKMLLRLYQDKTPSYLAIVFDAPGPTFRHKIYERYKATRPPTPEDLTEQIPYIKKIVEGFRVKMLEIEGYEADDIIGTLAQIATERGFYVVIVSGDKDFRQLITDMISMWDPMKDRLVNYKSIEEEYRIRPQQFTDVMALCGDSIDNIPGIPSVGEKTALELIRQFGTLENIYENISEVKKKRLKERLIEFKENAFLSRELVKINTQVPLKIDWEELKVREPERDRLSEIFKELEFISLWNQFAKREAETDKDYRICNDKRFFRELISEIKKKGIVSIDTESTSEDPMRAELVGISLSMEKDKGIYIPVAHKVKERQLDRDYVISGLKEVIEDPNIKKIGQNIKYDALIFKRNNMDIRGIYFDTMVASYVINPGLRQHNLNVLAQQYLNHKMISYKEVVGKGKGTFADVDLESAKEYACEDAEVVWRLWPILDEMLHKEGNASLFYELEMPLIEVLMDMEYSGVKIDEEFFKDMSIRISKELSKLEEEIFDEAGMEFNINSPQQLGFVLFEKLKLPVQKKTTKTKSYSTDVKVLETLSSLNYRLPSLILRYRSLSKLKSTYLDSLLQMINPETGRIHTSFNQTVTATGRLSSSNPNLQNIPIRGEEGREIRKGFIADEGNLLLSADYSQIELRIFAHYSQDPVFINAFREGIDIHTKTASEILGVEMDKVTDDMRRIAKAINFGIIYGMGPVKLSQELHIDRKEAQRYIESYYKRYKGVLRYREQMIDMARKKGYVTTLFNRKRYLPGINHSKARIRAEAERMAINTPIQGTAADLIKKAMINIHRKLKENRLKTRLILQVHDELVFEVPESELEDVKEMVLKEMEGVYPLSVPLRVDMGVGRNWGEAH